LTSQSIYAILFEPKEPIRAAVAPALDEPVLGGLTVDTLVRHLRETQTLAKLVGESPALLKTIELLPSIAASDATVLIIGETGAGKELVARALHYLSNRASFPFVPVNCGALSDMLFEDELFGHERGAFTGAHLRRVGLIAHAERGTLFLDEVDTLTLKAQIDLLRVLQEKTFRLVGSSTEQQANVRIVAATNAPIEQLLADGRLRADLYYRLCVFSVKLLPLRERKEDIPVLVDHFLKKHTPVGKPLSKLAPAAHAALMLCEWPGNVRELENAIIRGIHLTKSDSVGLEDLGIQSKAEKPSSESAQRRCFAAMKRAVIEKFERDYLTHLMSEHRGNISHAARTAGKYRRDFGRLLKKYELQPKSFRHPSILPAR
jgi:DNA-binding NtrC family response regulator